MIESIMVACFRQFSYVTLAFALLLYCALAQAMAKHDSLLVVTEEWRPFNYQDDSGKIVGSSTQWVKSVLDESGVDYQLMLYPWHRAYNLAKAKENVAIYSIYRSEEREHLFHWICPLPSPPHHKIYKLAERSDIVINSDDDLKDYTISVVRGAYTHDYLKAKGLSENLKLTSIARTKITTLLSKRVDLIVDFDDGMYDFLAQQGLKNEYVEAVYTFKQPPALCMAFSKNTLPSIVERVKEAHQRILAKKS